jgi:hypothetical protein
LGTFILVQEQVEEHGVPCRVGGGSGVGGGFLD